MADILSELMGGKGTPLTGDIDRDLQSQIDFYQQQGNIKAANQFREIQNEKNSMFGGFRDNLLNYYDTFEQITNPSFQEFVNQSNQQAARVIPEIQEQGKFVREKFGPNGEIAGKANAYFQDLIKTVNQSVSGQVATAANMNQRQGGSRAGLNASIQEARAQGLPLLSQIRGEERAEQERLYNNYMQLLSGLRNERIAVENENIKKPLLMLQERANALGTNIVNGLREMDALDIQEAMRTGALGGAVASSGGSSSSTGQSGTGGTQTKPLVVTLKDGRNVELLDGGDGNYWFKDPSALQNVGYQGIYNVNNNKKMANDGSLAQELRNPGSYDVRPDIGYTPIQKEYIDNLLNKNNNSAPIKKTSVNTYSNGQLRPDSLIRGLL